MKFFKMIFLGFCCLLFSEGGALAGGIGNATITADEGGPYVVNIDLTACRGDNTVITDSLGDVFLVQIFSLSDCGGNETDFTVSVEVPPCNSYQQVKIQLFNVNCQAKIPELGLVVQQDSKTIDQTLEVREDACCLALLNQCKSNCGDGNSTCTDRCEELYEECMNHVLSFSLSCHPETFNMKSNGNWITCHLQAGDDAEIQDVDYSSMVLIVGDESMPPDWYQEEGSGKLMLKFSRAQLEQLISDLGDSFPMTVNLTATGDLYDGRSFEADDTITAINPGTQNSNKNHKNNKNKTHGNSKH